MTQVEEALKQFKTFKIKLGLTSAAKIEELDDTLRDIGTEIGYLSHHYWAFTRKLRAQDRGLDVFNYINNRLGWLTIEFDAKMEELYKAYPVLND